MDDHQELDLGASCYRPFDCLGIYPTDTDTDTDTGTDTDTDTDTDTQTDTRVFACNTLATH